MSGPILVFAESFGGVFRKAAYEAVTEGRRLADLLKAEEHALAIGSGIKENAKELGRYGADKIILADDPSLALYNPDYYRQTALDIAKKTSPSMILAAATSTGKDLAPRLAIHLNTAVATECTHLDLDNGHLVATRPAYAGKVLVKVKITSSPAIATLRPNVFTAKEASPARNPPVEPVQFGRPDSRMVTKELVTHGAKKLDLTEANVIVSGGRGMGGPQNY
ncbi:electron transfer flavoprotein subunit alpha/FixB family protein, partial [Candidatus Bathyarchaeota archaeon]|nr:electron transfer flavoprotein subunit alpha/FixB family protein [Candidatus Bathyarchaeota archaeon]